MGRHGGQLDGALTLTLTLTPNPNPNPSPSPNPSPNPNQVGSWTAPFAMAQINTRVVYATVAPGSNPRLAAGPRQVHCSQAGPF